MKILLADDHAIVRSGLRSLLVHDLKMDVVGEASNGQEAINAAESLMPDLIIMDIEMPVLDGIQASTIIKERFPDIKIIILSMHATKSLAKKALKAGASGFVLKSQAFEELANAINAVKKNLRYLSDPLANMVFEDYLKLLSEGNDEIYALYNSLTSREKEIFNYLAKGYERVIIAEILNLSPKTVDNHKASIKEKLHIKSQVDIIKIAKYLQL